MRTTAWHHTTPPRWDKATRLIRIEALQSISFASQINRDWDEIAREVVENSNRQRSKAPRFNQGE